MIRTDKPPFGRLLTAMITPFDDDLKLDIAGTTKIVEHLIQNGTESIVVAGTTGESPTLEDAEKWDLLKLVLMVAKGKAKVIMGTGTNSTAKTIESSKKAEQLGAEGLLVVAPYYNKPSQAGLLKHFEEVAKATTLPIFVYNIPGRTGVNITPETMVDLAMVSPNVHALKDSTGNVEQSAEIAGKARQEFRIYSGDDYLTLPFLSIGACGIVSVASHIVGKQIQMMMTDFFEGKHDEARSIHYELLPLFKGLFAAPNPTCIKYAMAKAGLCKDKLRLPLVPLDAHQKEAMDKLLKHSKHAGGLCHA